MKTPLSTSEQRQLLGIARRSLEYGLANGHALPVHPEECSGVLREPGASFVTLLRDDELRGCIGSLQATRPLLRDVSENAFSAGFRDPRFPPIERHELAGIGIEISVLRPATELTVDSEAELLSRLRPGIDGLIIEEGNRRATFLPTVWEALPDPQQFLHQLQRKAGMAPGYWSDALRVSRYSSFSFRE